MAVCLPAALQIRVTGDRFADNAEAGTGEGFCRCRRIERWSLSLVPRRGSAPASRKGFVRATIELWSTHVPSRHRVTRTCWRLRATSAIRPRANVWSRRSLAKFVRIDTLVNNAGLFIGGAFTAITEAEYRAILSTNLDGFFNVTQPAVAAMERQGSGHVVQITTTLAERAMAAFPSVLASLTKGGLNAATRCLAIEYAERGIRVNAVSPGVVKTPMHSPETYEALANLHPLKRA